MYCVTHFKKMTEENISKEFRLRRIDENTNKFVRL